MVLAALFITFSRLAFAAHWTSTHNAPICKHPPSLDIRYVQHYTCSHILLSIILIGKVIESDYRNLLKPHGKNDDLANVQFRTLPGLSICTQFIGSLRCTLSVPNGPVCRNKLVLLYLCSILLTQSYAPEPNPGPRPIKFPCAICHKAVIWTTQGVCCDSCDVWYHQEFMGMPDCAYDGLKNVSWECFQCRLPNIFTSIFDTTIFETSNSFSQLSDHATTPESEIKLSYPVATSSPTRQPPIKHTRKRKDLPIRIVVLNCQSIKTSGKPAQLLNLISSLQADVIIDSESWLNPGIKSSEIFVDNFKCFRRDRPNGAGGGVFLLVSQEFQSSKPEALRVDSGTDCEVVWAKVKVNTSDPSTDLQTNLLRTICNTYSRGIHAYQRTKVLTCGYGETSTSQTSTRRRNCPAISYKCHGIKPNVKPGERLLLGPDDNRTY